MKMKSLLVAGLAVLAMNAVAEDKAGTSEIKLDINAIKATAIGETSGFINADCTMDQNMGNWKNVEFQLVLPEGLTGAACTGHNDTKVYNPVTEEDEQVLSWSWGMLDGLGLPQNMRCIGANLTATPIEKAQLNLCRLKFTMNAELAAGSVIEVVDFKVIDEGDNTWINANKTIDLEIEGSAVENINAGKAVAGVKYYNVAGQAADKAFDGVNVVVTTYADGTQNVSKVVK